MVTIELAERYQGKELAGFEARCPELWYEAQREYDLESIAESALLGIASQCCPPEGRTLDISPPSSWKVTSYDGTEHYDAFDRTKKASRHSITTLKRYLIDERFRRKIAEELRIIELESVPFQESTAHSITHY